MKQVFSGLMLMMLCAGLLTFAIKIQPASAAGPMPLSVSVTPHYAVMSGGQSQLFNSSVTGGSPPYTYQWKDGEDNLPGETNPTLNYTAPPYYYDSSGSDCYRVGVLVTDSAGITEQSWAWVWEPAFDSPVYYSVEPVPVPLLTDVNVSINGLETPPAPSPVGENFTVEIHLRNATATNVPYGVQGVEVHFYFGNILDYCKPIGFTNELGKTGSALVGPVIYAVSAGFYDNFEDRNLIATPPYANATEYIVAAAATYDAWNGADGLVARITFQITGQPSNSMGQPDYYAPLQIGLGDLIDRNDNAIPLSVVQGTLRIDGTPSLVGDLNGDGKVSLADLLLITLAYNSKVGDSNWNPLADLAAPYGIISLSDVLTLAMHYGQHYP